MENLVIYAIAWVVVYLVLGRLKVYISLNYSRKGKDDLVRVDVYLLRRFVMYRLEIPVLKLAEQSKLPWFESELDVEEGKAKTYSDREQRFVKNTIDIYLNHPAKWRELLKSFRYYTRLYRKFMSRVLKDVTCEQLCWRTKLGVDDAAITSMIVGLLWAFKNSAVVLLRRRIKFIARPVLQVVPLFSHVGFETEVQCIFTIRLGNVINATLSLVNLAWKGAMDNGRTPNTKLNENSDGKH